MIEKLDSYKNLNLVTKKVKKEKSLGVNKGEIEEMQRESESETPE
jgi:hypothetical protein